MPKNRWILRNVDHDRTWEFNGMGELYRWIVNFLNRIGKGTLPSVDASDDAD